jgi:hypothetical protein
MGLLDKLKPQQLLVSDFLDTFHDSYAVEIPRRATKTTSIFLKLLGRCSMREGYQVTFSAQSGIASSRRFREWANTLDRVTPPSFDEVAPIWMRRPKKQTPVERHAALFGAVPDELVELSVLGEHAAGGRRGFKTLRGAGNTRIEFDNGSAFIVLKPEPEAFRGEAADVSWFDEAQEIDPLLGDDLLAAVLPLQDTKPDASVLWSGTAPEGRSWPVLGCAQRGRQGDPETGILDFTAGDYSIADAEPIDWELLEDEESAMQLVLATHPGVGTLTTLEKMRTRWRKLGRPQFAAEYLSITPLTAGAAAIPQQLWAQAEIPREAIPQRVAFGLDIKPGGSVATIAAAWRDKQGTAYVEIVDHRQGTRWIGDRAQQLSSRYAGSTIAYDDIQEGRATATEMAVLRPKPRLVLQTYRDTAAGCVTLLRDLTEGTIRHFDQPGLNTAVQDATKREVRTERAVWLWTTGPDGGDITPLVAATRALRNWDQHFAGRPADAARSSWPADGDPLRRLQLHGARGLRPVRLDGTHADAPTTRPHARARPHLELVHPSDEHALDHGRVRRSTRGGDRRRRAAGGGN